MSDEDRRPGDLRLLREAAESGPLSIASAGPRRMHAVARLLAEGHVAQRGERITATAIGEEAVARMRAHERRVRARAKRRR